MNINFNQRFFSTEEKIQRALFSLLRIRRYDDISIKELCYEAGINRSSFYSHYQDINDLMIKTEGFLSKNIMEIFSLSKTWGGDVFERLFEFLYKYRDFYKAYLCENNQTFMERSDFTSFMDKISNKVLPEGMRRDNILYHMSFFAGGLKALAKSWLLNDCRETPKQMAEVIIEEYKSPL